MAWIQDKLPWLQKMRLGLKKSAQVVGGGLARSLSSNVQYLGEEQWEEIFETLVMGDVGPEFSQQICEKLKKQKWTSAENVLSALEDEIVLELEPFSQPFHVEPQSNPVVILMAGVNGSGKTTTIAKLTHQCLEKGLHVEWAACDTFRAAAVEQLTEWGRRLGVKIYSEYPGHGSKIDPASLAYYALQQATEKHTDVLFIDTAGRLQNNEALMGELGRTVKVLRKIDNTAPQQTLLVLDAATGQNLASQVTLFRRFVPITGLVITKLDGSSRAGAMIPICQKTGLPVVAIGVGESIEDMGAWQPRAWAWALLGRENNPTDLN